MNIDAPQAHQVLVLPTPQLSISWSYDTWKAVDIEEQTSASGTHLRRACIHLVLPKSYRQSPNCTRRGCNSFFSGHAISPVLITSMFGSLKGYNMLNDNVGGINVGMHICEGL